MLGKGEISSFARRLEVNLDGDRADDRELG
jgi:hypothetical protein